MSEWCDASFFHNNGERVPSYYYILSYINRFRIYTNFFNNPANNNNMLPEKTATSTLKEFADKHGLCTPEYRFLGEEGKSNDPTFSFSVSVGDHVQNVIGKGSSKKSAKHDASKNALEQILKYGPVPDTDDNGNFVGRLQEYTQKYGKVPPKYVLVSDTAGQFTYSVEVDDHKGVGTGTSKQNAKRKAARSLLIRLQETRSSSSSSSSS